MEFALHDSIQELYSNRIIPDSKLSIKYNSILVDDNNSIMSVVILDKYYLYLHA